MDVGDEDVKVSDMDITLDDSPDEYSDGLADVTDPDDSPRNHDRLYLDDVSDSESFASDEEFTSPDDLRSKAIQHALWFVESRYSSRASQAEVTRSLGVCRRLVEGISDDKDYLNTIPVDFQQALGRVKHLVLGMEQVDACVKDHHLFRDDTVTVCPVPGCHQPRYNLSGTARRAAFYVKPDEWMRQMLMVVRLCKQFDYMEAYIEEGKFRGEADDELRDFFDGTIYRDHLEPYIRSHGVDPYKTILCAMCFDDVEICRWPKKNICPVLLSVYNVAPWVRNLLTMLFMVAILPTNCKNGQLYLEPVVQMFAELKPGGSGFPVVSPVTGLTETWYAMIALTINDMRGISKGNCQVQSPAKTNACNCCAVRGYHIKSYGTTVYPSAVTFLPPGDPLRDEYRETFRNCQELRRLADTLEAPRFFSDEYVRAAMALAEDSDKEMSNDNHPAWTYGFFQMSCFVKHLDYWRPWMMNIRDTDHMLLNRVRLIINTLKGTGNMSGNPTKMTFENSLGRFEEYGPIVRDNATVTWPRAPWRALPVEMDFIDNVLPGLVRLPQSMFSGKFPRFFSDTLAIAHANLFFSGIGQILVYLCPSIAEPQREALLALIEATSHVLLPVFFGRELPEIHLQQARAQTLCEMRLPLSFCTMASHAFLEVFLPERGRVQRIGSCVNTHMVSYERFNKLLRVLLMQHKTPEKHLMLSMLRLHMVEMERVRQLPGFFPQSQDQSSLLGKLRSGAFDEKEGPDYIQEAPIIRKLGRVTRSVHLTPVQSEQLHTFFLEDKDQEVYQRAHRILAGNYKLFVLNYNN